MTLPDVSVNQPHPQSHNDERHVLNALLFPNFWSIEIDPFMPPATQTFWAALTVDGNAVKNGYIQATSASSSVIGWDVVLGAGTWMFSLLMIKGPNYGIYTIQLDGVTVGTIDGYTASITYNNVGSVSDIVVATSGKKRLTLSNPTKNALSSANAVLLQAVSLRRTA